MDTLMMALPIKHAPKNTLKGIRKWPQRNPARSNRGFGIEARAKITRNAFFYSVLYMRTFSLSIRGRPDRSFLFTLFSSIISSNSSDFLPAKDAKKDIYTFKNYHTCSRDIVRGEFSDGGAETPEESLNDNCEIDAENWDSWGACVLGTGFEVVESPTRWEVLGHIVALISGHCYFGNVWSQIQDKCV
jgi:hypothetical protein